MTIFAEIKKLFVFAVFIFCPGVCRACGWFDSSRLNNLVFSVLFLSLFAWLALRRKGPPPAIKDIPQLQEIDAAVKRCAETGRPVIFMTGRQDMSKISTVTAADILGEVAYKSALYGARLLVPHSDPVVMSVCQDITQKAYIRAGKTDGYREDMNFFLTDDQFAFTAAVDGIILRENPGACFYMGYYYSESLLMTETASLPGTVQIAGTDAEHQLPFFYITCDRTLIGEEFYAAGACFSGGGKSAEFLFAQDWLKVFVIAAVVAGAVYALSGTENAQAVLKALFY